MFKQAKKIISLQFLSQVPRIKFLLWLSPLDLCGAVPFLSKADDILFYKVGEVVNESLFPILSGLTLMQGCHCRPSPCSL